MTNSKPEAPLPSGCALQFQEFEPNPISGEKISVRIALCDDSQSFSVGSDVALVASLDVAMDSNADDSSFPLQNKARLEVQPNVKLSNGHASFWVKFHQSQSAIAKGTSLRYQLVVRCQDSTFASLIHAATSTMFEICNYRLVVIKQPPSVWYKDEGGKENTIQLSAILMASSSESVTKVPHPLHVRLIYNSPERTPVSNQDILDMRPEDSLSISASTGLISIRARITEVSKNHLKQAFCFLLEADPENDLGRIAPACSEPITVLSKRPKSKRWKTPSKNTVQVGVDSIANISAPHFSSICSSQPRSVMDAFQTWSEHTVRCLREIEWQHVGYLTSDDGSMDLSKPLLRCPSCWTYTDVFRRQEHNTHCMLGESLKFYSEILFPRIAQDPSASGISSAVTSSVSSPVSTPVSANKKQRITPKLNLSHLPSLIPTANSAMMMAPSSGAPIGTSFSASAIDPLAMPSLGFARSITTEVFRNIQSDEENLVYSILVTSTPDGFPAFTENGEIIGFYTSQTSNDALQFNPVPPTMSRVTLDNIRTLFQQFESDNSGLLVTRHKWISLDLVKERAKLVQLQLSVAVNNQQLNWAQS